VIELFAAHASITDVEDVIRAVVPRHLPPAAVLEYHLVRGGVQIRAGEPVSDIQRAALDAIRQRWP
jgi:hypothetical protein